MKKLMSSYQKLRRKILSIDNSLYRKLHKNKFTNEITIISSNNWKNKVTEDIMLERTLLRKNINTKIISWEQEYPTTKYSIIRSIWGYDKNIDKFNKYITKLKEDNKIIFNDYKIIENNFDKFIQTEILDKYNIPHIKTKIVYNLKELHKVIDKSNDKLVIKPCISAAGNNTYIINSTGKNSINKEEINIKFKDIIDTGIMIQPFINEINNGEISLVLINNNYSHSLIRYSGIFTNKNSVEELDSKNINSDIKEIIAQVKEIKEYKDYLYMRIDMVKIKGKYYIMEIELLEPQLFFQLIKDKKKRKQSYELFSNEIIKKLK